MATRSTPFLSALAFAAAHAIALPLAGAIIDVGSSPPGACEASSLEAALALAAATSAADEIRLPADLIWVLDAPLHLTDWNGSAKGSLTIAGGYSDCADTTPDDAHAAGIEAWGNYPVLIVDATGAAGSFVTLKRMVVQRTGGTAYGAVVTANGTLNLQSSEVFFHHGGGGVSVEGDSTLTVDAASYIDRNGTTGTDGGGVRCVGSGSFAYVDGSVNSNTGDTGGGIYVGGGCELALGPNAFVFVNEATSGGGVAAVGGAVVSSAHGAIINGNSASSSGGGLYAEGNTTLVQLVGTDISSNTAGFGGGGIYATAGSSVKLDGGGSCAGASICRSYLFHNSLDPGARDGAALRIANNAKVSLYQTEVGLNSIDEGEPDGSVILVEAGGELRTESAEVSFNTGADAVFQVEGGSLLQVAFTTVAWNYHEPDGYIVHAQGIRMTGSGTTGRINTSIFYPTAGYSATGGAAWSQVDCLITQTASGLGGGSFIVLADPQYTNVARGDLRPIPGSPAIDFCDAFLYAPTQGDLEGRSRGHDYPFNPNGMPGVGGGKHDAGAYELHEILIDGFETGSTARWSRVTT